MAFVCSMVLFMPSLNWREERTISAISSFPRYLMSSSISLPCASDFKWWFICNRGPVKLWVKRWIKIRAIIPIRKVSVAIIKAAFCRASMAASRSVSMFCRCCLTRLRRLAMALSYATRPFWIIKCSASSLVKSWLSCKTCWAISWNCCQFFWKACNVLICSAASTLSSVYMSATARICLAICLSNCAISCSSCCIVSTSEIPLCTMRRNHISQAEFSRLLIFKSGSASSSTNDKDISATW